MTATISSTEQAFLNAIRGDESTPFAERKRLMEDDAPRLVYADYLDGHGESERAEFIRVQVELAILPPNKPVNCKHAVIEKCIQCEPLHERSAELLKEWGERWTRELHREFHYFHEPNSTGWEGTAITYPGLDRRSPILRWQWSRGFISHITCTEADWERHGRQIVRAPMCAVERVTLSDKRPYETSTRLGYGWFSEKFGNEESRSLMVHDIWDRIHGHVRGGGESTYFGKYYDSEAAAIDALSNAAIAWAWEETT